MLKAFIFSILLNLSLVETYLFVYLTMPVSCHFGYVLLILHPFNGLFCRITCLSRYEKSKTSLDLNEAGDNGVWGSL